jgi:hypothetical protein
MLFSWCWLGGIWGFEGLDKGICWVFAGVESHPSQSTRWIGTRRGETKAYPKGDPRLKPRATSPLSILQIERAKPEGLAYPEAKAKTGILWEKGVEG